MLIKRMKGLKIGVIGYRAGGKYGYDGTGFFK